MISFKNEPLISFKTVVILAFVIVISFAVISILLSNESIFRMIFGDLATPIIGLLVIISLFYAAIRSTGQGKRVEIGWMLMALAFLSYFVGDVTWGILEIGLHQAPFPSVADVFYLFFYPLFALGIYYLPRTPFTRREEFKLVLDVAIVLITVGLIFWTFLIMPTLSKQEDFFASVILIIYILGDFFLLFVLLRLIYSKFEKVHYGPLILLGMGVIALFITDSVYYFQTVQGTYTSGGLLDTGWILSFILFGLAGLLQAFNIHYELNRWFKIRIRLRRSTFISYLPLIWVLIAFILLAWVNENLSVQNLELIEFGVGFVIFLVLIRQVITLNENKNLYLSAGKEINNREKAEKALRKSENYYRAIFENTGTAIVLIDDDMTISKVNSEVERLTGFSREEIEGKKKWTDFTVKEELNKLLEYYALRNTLGGAPIEYETKGMDKEGNIKDLLVTITTIPGTGKELASILEITDRKKAERALSESEKRLSDIIDFLPDATFAIDKEGKIIAWNRALEKMTGTITDDMMGKGNYEYAVPWYGERRPILIDLIRKENLDYRSEYDFIHEDGQTLKAEVFVPSVFGGKGAYLWVTASPLLDSKGQQYGAIESVRDITDRKKSEEKIKKSLEEKNLLLKEIHHRVKNNLQIISSLLDLQEVYVKEDATAVNVLRESQNRVLSMAMIHEMLYQSKDLSHINFSDYIRSLVSNLFHSYNVKNTATPIINVEQISLNIETAVPCGLIISELVSNSLKYAYPEDATGELFISLESHDNGYKLVISDNGIGFPEKLDFKNVESSLGLQLVNSLVNQLDGTIELDRSNGTKFTIKFKELKYKERI
jgi:two-component system, sensor histidine kinase PdtaS